MANQDAWNGNSNPNDPLLNAQAQAAQAQTNATIDMSGTSAGHVQGQQSVNTNSNNNATQNVAKDLPQFVNVLSKLETQISLTEKGREYHETLRRALEDKSWGKLSIKTIRLTDPAESYLFYDSAASLGIIVVYLESQFESDHEDSLVRLYGKARNTVFSMFEGKANPINILNVIGIAPEDYDKIGAMIADVKNTFISEYDTSFHDLSVNSIKDMNFSINPNLEKVKSFIRNISPHGIPAAMEYGFTVDIMMPKQNNQYFVTGFNQKRDYETKTIAAIVAKTNFLCNAPGGVPGSFNPMGGMGYGNMQCFLPVITITDIVSSIKSPELLPLYLTLAQQAFISTGFWKEPFKNFGVKGATNIGNLLENQQTHQLLEMSSSADVEAFIATYCRTPIMALAVTEGRSRILGMEWMSDAKLANNAIDIFNNFTDSGSLITQDPVVMRYAEYTGTCSINGEMVDSRYVDYLHIVADNPNEAPNLRPLLMLNSNPMDRAKMVRNISSDYKTKYITMNCALKADALNLMGGIISRFIRVQLDQNNNNNNFIGLDALIAESQKYVNTMGSFGGNNFGGYNYTGFFGYRP